MGMTVRNPQRIVMVVLGLAMGFGAPAVRAEEEQAQQFTPEFREVHKGVDAKHTPKITAPDSVRRGAWFNVTISVGAGTCMLGQFWPGIVGAKPAGAPLQP